MLQRGAEAVVKFIIIKRRGTWGGRCVEVCLGCAATMAPSEFMTSERSLSMPIRVLPGGGAGFRDLENVVNFYNAKDAEK